MGQGGSKAGSGESACWYGVFLTAPGPGPAALLQTGKAWSLCPDPIEAHGEPQTGSLAPVSPPTAQPRCVCSDCLLLPATLDQPLSTGLPCGKVLLLSEGALAWHRLEPFFPALSYL